MCYGWLCSGGTEREGNGKQWLNGPEPAIDLEVAGSAPVSCCFSIPLSFLTMCSSLPCLSENNLVSVPTMLSTQETHPVLFLHIYVTLQSLKHHLL